MLMEKEILNSLMSQETYSRKVIPFLTPEYFESKQNRVLFHLITEFFTKYNKVITPPALKIEVSNRKDLTESEFKGVNDYIDSFEPTNVDEAWLLDNTEAWCKKRALYISILDSISIIEGSNKDLSEDAIPKLLSDALAVSFDTSVGHDYIDDAQDRFDFYHRKDERLPFDIDILNKITKGGLIRKTLNCSIAETGAGKSAFMCHLAASTMKQGKHVLYISMEMAEERVAERIDANLMRVNLNDIEHMPNETYTSKIDGIKAKTNGRLIIKEFPTGGAHAGHFRALLEELKVKKDFKPDLIVIDYLGICASSRLKNNGATNSYTLLKSVAEELRGLAIEYDVPIWSALQVNRGGMGNSDLNMSDTADSVGILHVLDFFVAQMAPEELKEINQMMFKQLKNRYNDPSYYNKFVVGFDRPRMLFYNVEESAQENLAAPKNKKEKEDKPLFDSGSFGSRMRERGDFNFSFD